MFDLNNDDVPAGSYWTKLNRMASASSYGEPFFELLIGSTVGKWLIENALVEEVKIRPWPSRKPCYRVTELGIAVINRGPYAGPRPPRLELKAAPPRLQPFDTRQLKT